MAKPLQQIVVADDDPDLLNAMRHTLESWGYGVKLAASKQELMPLCRKLPIDLLILDVHFGDVDGIDLLGELVREGFDRPVIVLTAHGSVDNAVRAVKKGAFDFVAKPPDLGHLRGVIENGLNAQIAGDKRSAGGVERNHASEILGRSAPIREVIELIGDVAPTDAKVMILGESGTGKELVARAVHRQSSRADGPFIAVNMAALPDTLAESLLFGHEAGAFTGADKARVGWCEAADGGTLFFDEIGEMDVALQAKLLRFLQTGLVHRVGAKEAKPVDVRVVSATNRDPKQMIAEGLLREDLYYRLHVLPITLPPLRERPDDVPLLAEAFVERFAKRYKRRLVGISPPAMRILNSHEWPGNVRQLENFIERVVILCRDERLEVEHLPADFLRELSPGLPASPVPPPAMSRVASGARPEPARAIDRIEKRAIVDALEKTNGHVVHAAQMLGVGQATVYRKIKRYGIELQRSRSQSGKDDANGARP